MSFIPPAVDHVAQKIARVPGVEGAYIGKDGAVDAVLETAFDRSTRQHVLGIGMRAMVPVRVFYRMPDGEVIGESDARKNRNESLEDFYTRIHVAGFADDQPKATPDEVAGDAYGRVSVQKDDDTRDGYGQLKLARIRAKTRGRPVVGWRYGEKSLRIGDKVRFSKPCCLQWTMGRTVTVKPGAVATVAQMSSRRPIAYISIGGSDKVELPVHAVGHVYDVMVDPSLESVRRQRGALQERKSVLTPQMKRLVTTIGFGRYPGSDETPTNSPKQRGPSQPDLIGYQHPGDGDSSGSDEDMLAPPSGADGADDGRDDDRSVRLVQKPAKVRVRSDGAVKKKTVLLGRR